MEDTSGTAMPTSDHSSLEEHPIREVPPFDGRLPEEPGPKKRADPPADPPAVASNRYDSTTVEEDRVQSPSSSAQSEEDEGAVSSNAPFQQTTTYASHKSEPSKASRQSHQTHQSHLTASTGSGPNFKDQVNSRSVVADPMNNYDSNIVFANDVQVVPMSVTVNNESRSHDEENAAPYEPPAAKSQLHSQPKAPPPQEDGGRRCSKRTLIIAAVAVVVIIAGVVGGVVGAVAVAAAAATARVLQRVPSP